MQPGARGLGKGQKSRRELTEIAIDCFARYGYQGSSVDRIARMAGVTKGAIYYHFRDKEDLLAAAVADRVQEFEARVERACQDVTADLALRRIANVCIEHARSNDHPRFAITLMIEAIDTNATVSAQLTAMMRRFRAFLRNLIAQGKHDGLFREDADADAAAASYTSCILGAEIQYYQDPERFRFGDAITTFLDQLIENLAARSEAPTSPGGQEE